MCLRAKELSIIKARSLNKMMDQVGKLYIIKVSHPYLYYHSLFRKKWFSPMMMRFSIHLSICFQLRHWEKSLGCPTNHGYSSLSMLIPLSITGKSPQNISFYTCPLGTGCLRGCKWTWQQNWYYSPRAWELNKSQTLAVDPWGITMALIYKERLSDM